MAVDLAAFLHEKTESLMRSSIDASLDGADRLLRVEIAKGDAADPALISELAKKIATLVYPGRVERIKAQLNEGLKGRRVLCIVDFSVIPYTFNVLIFLFIANKFRIEQGADILDIAFVAHASDPGIYRQEHHSDLSMKKRFRTLANNIGIAAAQMVPSIGSTMFFDNRTLFGKFLDASRAHYDVFPTHYSLRYPLAHLSRDDSNNFSFVRLIGHTPPRDVLALSVPAEERGLARRWMRKNVFPAIPITVTLRTISFETNKNSDPQQWTRILSRIKDPRVKFVIVPDYYEAYRAELMSGNNIVYCDDAVLTMPFRSAIYGASAFNIFGNNGPLAIGCLAQDINYLCFLNATEEGCSSAPEIERNEGLHVGAQFWGATDFQRLVWEIADEDVIYDAIVKMIDDLDREGILTPAWYSETA